MESSEFGRMLRGWRDRVEPATVGLPAGGRRRATGLRREEVAHLSGISVDYLTRLEQGRATSPSAQVVEALARALRLPDADRDVLFRLAGHVTPGRDVISSRVSPSVQRLLDRLAHTPVVVYDAAWNLVIANEAYDALMGATTTWRGRERNAVWRNIVLESSRAVSTSAETKALQVGLVADLRLTAARYPGDQRLRGLIADLRAASPRFADLWESTDPSRQHEPARHKIIDHPTVGRIALDCDTLTVAVEDLRIMVYTAEPGTEDAERLALATVVGNQALG
ncbi:helix-turn-helix transcriptional regulator [Nocardioides sp. NBC_00850]|uniref:helix-turn-helix transcriptional regulator n=1 Tax=Nocardioides sp. NBC_00850 TaxID=2976001 RepID=UPI003862EAF9|nr:helix-turn-helix transcriptional regulator [Nocardioides sp. NBC_00850]